METTRCSDCDDFNAWTNEGNGKCGYCHGEGYYSGNMDRFVAGLANSSPMRHPCEECSTSGRCQTCDGRGRVRVTSRPLFDFGSSPTKNLENSPKYNYPYEPDYSSRGSDTDDVTGWIVGIIVTVGLIAIGAYLFNSIKGCNPQQHLKQTGPVQQTERVYIENPASYPLNENVVHKHADPIEPREEGKIKQIPLEEESSIPQVEPEIVQHYDQYGRPISAEGRPLYKIHLEDGLYRTIDNCNSYVWLSIRGSHLLVEGAEGSNAEKIIYSENYYCTSPDEPNTYFFSENSEAFIWVVAENEITFFNHNRMCVFKRIQ